MWIPRHCYCANIRICLTKMTFSSQHISDSFIILTLSDKIKYVAFDDGLSCTLKLVLLIQQYNKSLSYPKGIWWYKLYTGYMTSEYTSLETTVERLRKNKRNYNTTITVCCFWRTQLELFGRMLISNLTFGNNGR